MPPAARRARESAPDARRTSAPGRGAVRKTDTANLSFTAPSSRYRREGPTRTVVVYYWRPGDLATGTGDLATCWRPALAVA
eukprot:6057997-Prymnesium_polylepis.1